MVKRALRAAVVVPGTFALSRVIGEHLGDGASATQLEVFAAFGSIALLLLVEFSGRPAERLRSYGALMAGGSVLIVLATLCSTTPALAALSMGGAAFVLLMAGVSSRQVAAATVAALLTFVLPVAVAAPVSELGPRLAGWWLAGALAVPAALLVWPPPYRDPLRERLAGAISSLAAVACCHADGTTDPARTAEADVALAALDKEFDATTFRPTTGASSDLAIPKLYGRVQWAATNALLDDPQAATLDLPPVRRTDAAAAAVLERAAALLVADPAGVAGLAEGLTRALAELEEARTANQGAALRRILEGTMAAAEPAGAETAGAGHQRVLGVLDPTFRARAFGLAAGLVGEAALEATALPDDTRGRARVRRWAATWRTAWATVRSHFDRESVWLRNSIRGAVGLAVAVGVVEVTDLQHGFWIVLGTLSVLRSNAVGTGATAFQAITGTLVGFLVGSVVLLAIGNHDELLWALLPVAVFIAAYAPQAISFTAGQASFTLVVLILFNILHPAGISVGVARVENVAIGCAVSLGVGLLLWPRGAAAALGHAICDAYLGAGRYLQAAVDRVAAPFEDRSTEEARAETRPVFDRLDDAFRQYLWERGTRPVAVETMTALTTGAGRTRLAALSLAELPNVAHRRHRDLSPAAVAAGDALRRRCRATNAWYGELGSVLAGRSRRPPDVPPLDRSVRARALVLFDEARRQRRTVEIRTALRILWADEALDDEAALQHQLAAAAVVFAERPRLGSPVTWLPARLRPGPAGTGPARAPATGTRG